MKNLETFQERIEIPFQGENKKLPRRAALHISKF